MVKDMEAERQIPEEYRALEILDTLTANGYEAYFAGGCVRDFLLHRAPHDFDIATSATPAEVVALFPEAKPVDPSQSYPVCIVYGIEVATFRTEVARSRHDVDIVTTTSYAEDASRRDFTMNALYQDRHGNVLDPTGTGTTDIGLRRIRFVGDPKERIEEDPLRILRAFRFTIRFDMHFHWSTFVALKDAVRRGYLLTVPADRIRMELFKMLEHPNRVKAMKLMFEMGVLESILPEVYELAFCEQGLKHHMEGDVFTHTMMALDSLPPETDAVTAFAVLLHDVGKPATRKVDGAKVMFYGHDKRGAEIADKICRRLNLSTKDRERVVWCVDQHMRVRDIPKMKASKIARFIEDERFPTLMKVLRADDNGAFPLRDSHTPVIKTISDFRAKRVHTLKDFGINGNFIKEELDVEPGPIIGVILRAANKFLLENPQATREEVVEICRKTLQSVL